MSGVGFGAIGGQLVKGNKSKQKRLCLALAWALFARSSQGLQQVHPQIDTFARL